METMPVLVTLTVVVVVGVLVIQLFSAQIADKNKELKTIDQSRAMKEAVGKAKQFCQERCISALENDCNAVGKSQFCLSHIKLGLDMDGDGEANEYTEQLLGGVGVCEDKVYCSHLTDCTCKVELTTEQCINVLCEYWGTQGLNDQEKKDAFERYLSPGSCDVENQPLHWFNLLPSRYKDTDGKLICP